MKITILYGSETGNTEALAEMATKRFKAEGYEANYLSMDDVQPEDLPHFETLILMTSTWGDGEPPTNAYALWEALSKKPTLDMSNVRFAVLALGDTGYPEFCKCGRDFDEWFEEFKGKRILARVDCDIDFETPYAQWIEQIVKVLSSQAVA